MPIVKRSMATVIPRFSARRMVKDYIERAYAPAFRKYDGREG
jgi:hypothetical protein